MKILLVNKLYAPDIGGGAEITIAHLAAGLQARGHEILVATTTAGDEVVENEVAGVPVIRLPLRNVYWHNGPVRHGPFWRVLWHARDRSNEEMGRAVAAVMKRFDPDLVAFHNLAGFSSAAWDAAFVQRRPAIQVLHDYYHLCPRSQLFRDGANCTTPCGQCRLFRGGRAAQSNGLQAVVGVSQAVLDAHLRGGLFEGVGVRRVINNARPSEASRSQRDYPPTARVLGFIGTLAEWKGIGRLLDAFSRVAAEDGMPPLRLLVAGQGDAAYEAGLRARYASDRIEFLGRVTPESFYPRIDVCVVPSLWNDPLPGVVFESLLSGVPVIGARRGGIPEMVTDRIDGLLYDPDEPAALDACIREMATTPGRVREYGERGLRGAGRFADMDRVVDEHLAVYRTVLRDAA